MSNNYEKMLAELSAKMDNLNICPELRKRWIPKNELMKFLEYADTQMATITKQYNLVTTTIGKRKFYLVDSVQKILDNNQSNNL